MDIEIPSPSVFLHNSPVRDPKPPVAQNAKPGKSGSGGNARQTQRTTKENTTVTDGGVVKPKQSKSRNGCMTCKKKRLKCDETKPACVQCQKRNVVCEGYKKDYKWRSFEETAFKPTPNVTKPRKTLNPVSFGAGEDVLRIQEAGNTTGEGEIDPKPSIPNTWSPGLHTAFETATQAFHDVARKEPIQQTSLPAAAGRLARPKSPIPKPTLRHNTTSGSRNSSHDGFDTLDARNALPAPLFREQTRSRSPGSTFSSNSPQLLDLLLPGTDLNQPPDPSELRPPMSPLPYQPGSYDDLPTMLDPSDDMADEEEVDEEIVRESPSSNPHMHSNDNNHHSNANFMSLSDLTYSTRPRNNHRPTNEPNWLFREVSPAVSENSTSSSSKSTAMSILAQPKLDASTPEMLMLRFDRATCGILSVKDGPTENPWRTLIWPLAKDSPALYHAIASMTAFHGAYEVKGLNLSGIAHMTQSLKRLTTEMASMQIDSVLATSLALAFSEGWDRHVCTGVQHLKGAKIMVNNALIKHRHGLNTGSMNAEEATRLKFLCNTFVYMDVIARLTSLEEASGVDLDEVLLTVNSPYHDQIEVDPLMGCATTLFPVIGRVAGLIQQVRKTQSNSLTIVSRAMELKEQLHQWQVPDAVLFETPEDSSSEVQHSIQTAEAYRYATLLYLHQAVPEIPSDSSERLAKRVLMTIASVPLSSRAIIVQIYPLFAASCEVTSQEDRSWVVQRWIAMGRRLKLGNIDSCWNVVQEVWSRRDMFEAEKAERLIRRYNARGVPNGNFVPPVLSSAAGKKRAINHDVANGSTVFGDMSGYPDDLADHNGRPFKRRVTLDVASGASGINPVSINAANGLQRRTTDMSMGQIEHEYTVRGRLHWLGVMQEWDWEVFLG